MATVKATPFWQKFPEVNIKVLALILVPVVIPYKHLKTVGDLPLIILFSSFPYRPIWEILEK